MEETTASAEGLNTATSESGAFSVDQMESSMSMQGMEDEDSHMGDNDSSFIEDHLPRGTFRITVPLQEDTVNEINWRSLVQKEAPPQTQAPSEAPTTNTAPTSTISGSSGSSTTHTSTKVAIARIVEPDALRPDMKRNVGKNRVTSVIEKIERMYAQKLFDGYDKDDSFIDDSEFDQVDHNPI